MNEIIGKWMALPYTFEFEDNGKEVFAKVAELPGCITEASSMEEAEVMIRDAMFSWLSCAIADEEKIPLPSAKKILASVGSSLYLAIEEIGGSARKVEDQAFLVGLIAAAATIIEEAAKKL